MDKKNTFIGALFIAAAIACIIFSRRFAPQVSQPAEERQEVAKQLATAPTPPPEMEGRAEPIFESATQEPNGAKVTTLENSFIQVHFTNFGGAIRDVVLKNFPKDINNPEPFVFNEHHENPVLAIVDYPGLDRNAPYTLTLKSEDQVVYRTVVNNQMEVTRSYRLSPDHGTNTDPYQLRSETTFRNLTDRATAPVTLYVSLGTAEPANIFDNGQQLVSGYYTGDSQTFIARTQIEESAGLFGLGIVGNRAARPFIASPGPIVWGTVKNAFFSSIYTPDSPAASLITRRVKVLTALPDTTQTAYGVTATAVSTLPELAPHGEAVLGSHLYVGPNEYTRLANQDVFKADQDQAMQFGSFKIIRFCAELLLTLMTTIHRFIPNWGLAIVLTTLSLKVAFLPLSLPAARSAKRMQALMPEMNAIKEKFKDNPQKQQAATLELYKKHKVNPLGGCLPMIISLPFFWGFFSMLRNTTALRFAPFALWIRDLSVPDTIFRIHVTDTYSFPINILPLLLGVMMYFQTKMTPAPTVDNAQTKMMKLMPVMFIAFYYSWASALSLYSLANGLFTIGQQIVVNRMHSPPEPVPAKSPTGRPMKNVTPGRKK